MPQTNIETRFPWRGTKSSFRRGGREVPEEGGLRRSRGFREGPRGTPPEDRRVPWESGAGVRAAASPGRGVDPAGTYLRLEVCDRQNPVPSFVASRTDWPRIAGRLPFRSNQMTHGYEAPDPGKV